MLDRVSHVAIGAGEDVLATIDFYSALLGVVEVARDHDTIYLSGGRKSTYDIAVGPWESGLHHFAFEAPSLDVLEIVRNRLQRAGSSVHEVDITGEVGLEAGVGFVMPSGHLMEVVVAAHPTVFPGTPRIDVRHFRGVGPTAIEHVSLNLDDVGETTRFLAEALDFRITEYSQQADESWFLAFLRARELHHDLGLFHNSPGESGPRLNHFAFVIPSCAELVRFADLARGRGLFLQCSPGRHLVGDNLFVYIADPSGNRVEVSTPLTRVEDAAPTQRFEAADDTEWIGNFDAWRPHAPPAARTGQACYDGREAPST
jgi:catechol 2,3-dioxygenase